MKLSLRRYIALAVSKIGGWPPLIWVIAMLNLGYGIGNLIEFVRFHRYKNLAVGLFDISIAILIVWLESIYIPQERSRAPAAVRKFVRKISRRWLDYRAVREAKHLLREVVKLPPAEADEQFRKWSWLVNERMADGPLKERLSRLISEYRGRFQEEKQQ